MSWPFATPRRHSGCDASPPRLYQVACIYALTSKQQPDDRLQAFQLLSSALRKGYGFQYLEIDTDLDPLRPLPEFRRLTDAARRLGPSRQHRKNLDSRRGRADPGLLDNTERTASSVIMRYTHEKSDNDPASPKSSKIAARRPPLATLGPTPAHLTLSFAPDGTQVGSHTSNLFQSLNQVAPTKTWQLEILRAFQTWAAQANINMTVVADDGLPLGATGADSERRPFRRHPHRRICRWARRGRGRHPLRNRRRHLVGRRAAQQRRLVPCRRLRRAYDLFSVMVHEAGHVFGLDHNPDSSSVMFEDYVGPRRPRAGDVSSIQALYGAPHSRPLRRRAGNDQLSTATRLNPLANGNGSLASSVSADITTLRDKDVYSFNTLLNLGAIDITLRTAGNSLLAPHVTVYDGAGRIVAQALSTDPLQGGFVLHLKNVFPLRTYYVQIDSGRQDVFGIGSYQLTINELGFVNNLLGGLTSTVTYGLNAVNNLLINNDLYTNDRFATATALPAMAAGLAFELCRLLSSQYRRRLGRRFLQTANARRICRGLPDRDGVGFARPTRCPRARVRCTATSGSGADPQQRRFQLHHPDR